MVSLPPLRITDIHEAAARLAGVAVATPSLRSEVLDERSGATLLIKAEPLQRTGSFKFRGAYNAILASRPKAVVAFSSGNHAQGVALAARLLGVPASIVMPADAPRVKLDGTRALGAEVVTYDRHHEVREAIGAEIAERTGATLIKPYDDPLVMAGQGTVGLELAAQAAAMGLELDAAIVCCGGGGLTAGCAVSLVDALPEIAVFTAEPQGFDDTARSLAAGERLANAPGAATACDALQARTPGELTFAVNRRLVRGGLAVSEDEVFEAMRLAFSHLKLVVEPGGAVALAAALFRRGELGATLNDRATNRPPTIGVVVSGGNVDPELFANVLRAG